MTTRASSKPSSTFATSSSRRAIKSASNPVTPPSGTPAWRCMPWLLAMQNDAGGWAAFDRTRNREILEHVPFADHNAMQDPSCPDITGRVLECLGHCGFKANHPAVKNAINFVHCRQETEGCWF